MELKVRKDKNGKEISVKDASDYKDEIRHKRNYVAIVKEEYDKATTPVEKRIFGMEVNSTNAEIKSLRDGIREVAFDSVAKAQLLDSEIQTMQGMLASYRDIDESEIEATMEEFGDYYYKIPDILDEINRGIKTATGEEKRILQDKYSILHVIALRSDIGERKIMIRELLPDKKGIESPEDVAESVEVDADYERKKWFDNGKIKDMMMQIIKYGKPAGIKYVLDDKGNYVEEEDKDAKRIIGVLEGNIEERAAAINKVGGVWTTVGETATPIGSKVMFTEQELDKLASVQTPDEMVARINDMCTTDQRNAFANALGDIDKDGNLIDPGLSVILKKADVVCNVPNQEIYEAFHRMKELETGVDGSGYEYMRMFLKRLFKYGAFKDNTYNKMSKCDDINDLLDIIGEEITDCSCVIRDTHENEVRMAFEDKEALDRETPGKGVAYMNRKLRNIFNCDTFEEYVYRDMAEYEDPEMLVSKINTELSNAGVYDKEVLKHAMDGVDRKAVLSKAGAERQLDDVFGDHFTKLDYIDAAKHVMSEDSVVDGNRSALIKRFRTIGREGQILAGKTLEGITNDDYNERWDRETQKMIKHGETKNIEAIILKRQVEAAQKQFANLVEGIPDDSMSSRDEIRYVFESVGLQDYIVRNLSTSVTDLEYVVDDNIQKLTRGMRDLIKKHDMYEDDIFREGRIYDAINKRKRMELGDSTGALRHMKDAIINEVGKLDMTDYSESIKSDMTEKISRDYGDIDEKSVLDMPEDDITAQFSRRIKRYRLAAAESIRNAEKSAIKNLYAGRSLEDNVLIPPEISTEEMLKEHEEEIKVLKPPVVVDVPKALAPFLSTEEIGDYTDAIPKKPKKLMTPKGKAEMKWWETYMAKNEPILDRMTPFNSAGLALVMRKGIGKKYVVYGEGGNSVGFKNLNELDKWFKAHYSK